MSTSQGSNNSSSAGLSAAQAFLNTLFHSLNGEFIELRPFDKSGAKKQSFYPSIDDFVSDFPRVLNLAQQTNIYVGVCPRSEKSGKKHAVKRAYFLWADMDAKNFTGGKADALEKLKAFPLPPTMIVDSGNGYHAYWQLSGPFLIEGANSIIMFENYLHMLADCLNADHGSCTLERVLRLPDTLNHKKPDNLLIVTMVEHRPANAYPLLSVVTACLSNSSDGKSATAKAELKYEAFFKKHLGELLKSGENALAVCPFHDDHTPSLSVHLAEGIWHCFGSACRLSGNIIQFAQRLKLTDDEMPQIDDEIEKGVKSSVATKLIKLVLAQDIELFHDRCNRSYARLVIGDHTETWPLDSEDFERWLSRLYWDTYQKALPSDAINPTVMTLSAKACFEKGTYDLQNRVAYSGGAIFVDLSDKGWRAVRVDSHGWSVVDNPPILFRRYGHQIAQVEPLPGGDLKEVLRFVNLSNQEHQLLFLVSLVGALVPEIGHPIDVPHGEQGAAKSTLLSVKRHLIDPSIQELQVMPTTEAGFAQLLDHHYYPCFDNVGRLSDEQSDMLCRAVTGGALEKRKLYTDDDDIFFRFKRPIGLNSINLVVQKADLLDRSLLFKLDRITEDKRLDETIFWERFRQAKPFLLGAMFDVLSKAMRIFPTIQTKALFRMADFTKWGCAIAQAMGYSQTDFINAYKTNVRSQNDEAIQASPVAVCIIDMMKTLPQWDGSASELLDALEKIASSQRIDVKGKSWPKAPNSLMRKINVVRTNLREEGIKIEQDNGGDRRIHIVKDTVSNSQVQKGPHGAGPAIEGFTEEAKVVPIPEIQTVSLS